VLALEFTLLDNGLDSLKKTQESLKRFNELHRPNSYHLLKDAIIFLNHGIEILLKYILSSRNESLIFKDIKMYMKAKEQLKHLPLKEKGFGTYLERNIPTVFDVPKDKLQNKKLETITLREAVDRIELLCDIEITKEFGDSIYLINKYRNDITHHSIKLTTQEEQELINELKILYVNILGFFEEQIPGIYEKVDLERFEVTQEEVNQWQQDMEDFYHERAMSDLSEEDIN
jgi:hypothetical protein